MKKKIVCNIVYVLYVVCCLNINVCMPEIHINNEFCLEMNCEYVFHFICNSFIFEIQIEWLYLGNAILLLILFCICFILFIILSLLIV